MHRFGLSFHRRDRNRLVAGVAGGFADQHGVDVLVVRGALVVLAFAGGIGFVVYAAMAIVAEHRMDVGPIHPHDQRRNVAVGCVALGMALLVRSSGIWLGDRTMAPLIVIATGVVVLGVVRNTSPEAQGRSVLAQATDMLAGRNARWRVIGGSALIAIGLISVGAGGGVSTGVRTGVVATAASILGVAVLLGPWLTRLAQEAADERRQRIRFEERSAMAEHLHDSVLQTLALIQRSADDPRRTVTLARQQEHELRAWLYGERAESSRTLSGTVRDLALEIEGRYQVRLDVVVVGDREMDDQLSAVCGAIREACTNAAKHSGVSEVSVFVEDRPESIEAFVRDRGRGFDRLAGTVAPSSDRRGISQSIEARMERVGGRSEIVSTPGTGTEVRLWLALHAAPPVAEVPAQ